MPPLTDDDVRSLARAAGIVIEDADVREVRLRLEVNLEHLRRINEDGLDALAPDPVPGDR